MISACIFDLDGVIVDTAHLHYLSWKRLAIQLGFEFTEAQNENMKGISRMASLEVVLDIGKITATQTEKLKMAHVKNEWYKEYLQSIDESIILPGVQDFLQELTTHNIPYVLGSASRNAKLVMSKIGIADGFSAMFDGNDTVKSKPDPEVFIKGAEYLKLDPEKIIVFEDSHKGIAAANTGRFISCGVGNEDTLRNADLNIPTFKGFTFADLRSALHSLSA